MSESTHDFLQNIDRKFEGIQQSLDSGNIGGGGGTDTSLPYGNANNKTAPATGVAILLEAENTTRQGIFISNNSDSGIVDISFGANDISGVTDNTTTVHIRPLGTELIEIPSLVSKNIHARSRNGQAITIVYHLREEVQTGGIGR